MMNYALFVLTLLVMLTRACDEGWIENGGNCYFLGNVTNYNDAFNYCHEKNAHMLTILSKEEQKFITSTMNSSSISGVHLGLHSVYMSYEVYQWHDGAVFAYSKFPANAPDYAAECVSLDLAADNEGWWSDHPCSDSRKTICKNSPDVNYGCIEILTSDLNPYLTTSSEIMSVTLCYQKCQGLSKKYSAVHDIECYCFDEFPTHTNLSWSMCGLFCPGHTYQLCGGWSGDKIVFVTGSGTAGMLAESCTELELIGITNDTFRISHDGQMETVDCSQGNVTCPRSWVNINDKCYRFIIGHPQYPPASVCTQLSGYLAPVHNDDLIDTFRNVINNSEYLRGPSTWMVGLFDMDLNQRYRSANGQYVDLKHLTVNKGNSQHKCYGFVQNSSVAELVELACDSTSYICAKGEDYLGCYTAPSSAAVLNDYHDNSIQQCVETCRGNGTTYAMVQQTNCWCEDVLTDRSDNMYCDGLCFEYLGQSCPAADSQLVAVYRIAAYPSYATSCEELSNQGVTFPGMYEINSNTTLCLFTDDGTVCSSSVNGSCAAGKDGVCFSLSVDTYKHAQSADGCHQNEVLASIHNEKEFQLLQQIVLNCRSSSTDSVFYSGGFDQFGQGLFSWADGTLMTFAPWSRGSQTMAAERALVFNVNETSYFDNDYDDTVAHRGACREVKDYLGCYLKTSDLVAVVSNYSSMLLTVCKQVCLGQQKQVALVHPTDCFCLDEADLASLTSASDSDCNTTCPGNKMQLCGGENAMRAYKLDYNDIAENCSVLYNNGVLLKATYLLRNPFTGNNYTTTCGFSTTGSCRPGWIAHNGSCLLVVVHQVSLSTAAAGCADRGSVLFTPEDEDSVNFISSVLSEVPAWSQFSNWHVGAVSLMNNLVFQTADGHFLDLQFHLGPSDTDACLYLNIDPVGRQRQHCMPSQPFPYVCQQSAAYLGCKHFPGSPAFTTSLISMSVGQCVEYCRGHRTSQAGVIGSTCYCFDDVTAPSSDEHCNVTCSHTIVQTCGSSDGEFMSLYSTGLSNKKKPTTCQELIQYGVMLPSKYVIYPLAHPVYVNCFITGTRYSPVLGSSVGSIRASSARASHTASRARIGFDLIGADVWIPRDDDGDVWLEVELDAVYVITGVITQGARDEIRMRTTSFRLKYGVDGTSWLDYSEELPGNSDSTTPVVNFLVKPFLAIYVRFVSLNHTAELNGVALRVELLGQKYELSNTDAYVGCFGYYTTFDYFHVLDLISIEECAQQCGQFVFYGVVNQHSTSECICVSDVSTYGRLDDVNCSYVSNIGTTPSGLTQQSIAVFRSHVLHCPEAAAISDGSVTNTTRRIGSTVTYSCDAGFEISAGVLSLTRKCLATNQWSETSPVCHRFQCPVYPSVLVSLSVGVSDDQTVTMCSTVYNATDHVSTASTTSWPDYSWSHIQNECALKGGTSYREATVPSSQTGRRSVGDLELLTTRSKFDCASSCLSHGSCHSFNFRAGSAGDNCELVVGVSTSRQFETATDWNSYQLSDTFIRT